MSRQRHHCVSVCVSKHSPFTITVNLGLRLSALLSFGVGVVLRICARGPTACEWQLICGHEKYDHLLLGTFYRARYLWHKPDTVIASRSVLFIVLSSGISKLKQII